MILHTLAMLSLKCFCGFGLLAGGCAGCLLIMPGSDKKACLTNYVQTIMLSLACGVSGLVILVLGLTA